MYCKNMFKTYKHKVGITKYRNYLPREGVKKVTDTVNH